MVQRVEPQRGFSVRMLNSPVACEKRVAALWIFMGAREQSKRKIEKRISGAGVGEVDQACELQAAAIVLGCEHVPLLQIVVAQYRSDIVSENARPLVNLPLELSDEI